MRERGLGEHVVREPVGELRERVRGQRRDHEQVGARQMRIRIVVRRSPCECMERLGANEPLRTGCDERDDVVPALDEQARELARFVSGDSTGNTLEDLGQPTPFGRSAYFL